MLRLFLIIKSSCESKVYLPPFTPNNKRCCCPALSGIIPLCLQKKQFILYRTTVLLCPHSAVDPAPVPECIMYEASLPGNVLTGRTRVYPGPHTPSGRTPPTAYAAQCSLNCTHTHTHTYTHTHTHTHAHTRRGAHDEQSWLSIPAVAIKPHAPRRYIRPHACDPSSTGPSTPPSLQAAANTHRRQRAARPVPVSCRCPHQARGVYIA